MNIRMIVSDIDGTLIPGGGTLSEYTKRVLKACEEKGVHVVLASGRTFYGARGGLTLSGGEPLLHADAAIRLLSMAKAAGIGTAVETCGFFDVACIPALAAAADTLLWDIKDTDSARHRQYTGVPCEPIVQNLLTVDRALTGGQIRLRCLLIGGVNTDRRHLDAVAALFARLEHGEGVELLACHAFGFQLFGDRDVERHGEFSLRGDQPSGHVLRGDLEIGRRHGDLLAAVVGPGDFTKSGHFLLIRDFSDEGFILNDPNSAENSARFWPFDVLMPQIKNIWALSAGKKN